MSNLKFPGLFSCSYKQSCKKEKKPTSIIDVCGIRRQVQLQTCWVLSVYLLDQIPLPAPLWPLWKRMEVCAFLILVLCLCLLAKQWLYRGNVIMTFYYMKVHLKFADSSMGTEMTQLFAISVEGCKSQLKCQSLSKGGILAEFSKNVIFNLYLIKYHSLHGGIWHAWYMLCLSSIIIFLFLVLHCRIYCNPNTTVNQARQRGNLIFLYAQVLCPVPGSPSPGKINPWWLSNSTLRTSLSLFERQWVGVILLFLLSAHSYVSHLALFHTNLPLPFQHTKSCVT